MLAAAYRTNPNEANKRLGKPSQAAGVEAMAAASRKARATAVSDKVSLVIDGSI